MSASQSPTSEQNDPRTISYDPTDPFWRDTDEDDDDDMNSAFEYAPGEEEEEEDEEEGEYYFHDAEEQLIEVEFGDVPEGGGNEGEGQGESGGPPAEATNTRRVYLTADQIMRLLGHAGLGRLFSSDEIGTRRRRNPLFAALDSDDEDGPVDSRRKRGPRGRAAFQKVPSEEGRALMNTGTFGTNDRPTDTIQRKKRLQHKIMRRELGLGGNGRQRNEDNLMKQDMIPGTPADTIIHYNARCYSGQFSDDGNFFFSCAQDFKVRMYDTSNPYDWKYYKTVEYPFGQWTITDASLSPDNRFLAYSSIKSIVCLAPTDPENDKEPTMLDFANVGRGNARTFRNYFGIWSIRFSGDGREIVAGTGDNSVYVYDIERQQSILRIPGHQDDVNAVCYGDAHSPHILYSGSDDTTLKVWDRRSMGDGREAGVFLGHTEGLTYVDSKGDGRYVLSNAKDQTAKLWDLRKMMSKDEADPIDIHRYTTRFEYRSNAYPEHAYVPHPHDCSLVTFRGHKVLKTLIRCHFSPPGSTDSRYVYSGSYDGSVYVWNLDATLAGKIDVLEATRNSRPRDPHAAFDAYDFMGRGHTGWMTCVRDASWHPNAPVIAATSWNGWGTSQGTCTVHTWNDGMEDDEAEPKVGRRVNARLRHDPRLYREPGDSRRPLADWLMQEHDDDEDEEDEEEEEEEEEEEDEEEDEDDEEEDAQGDQ